MDFDRIGLREKALYGESCEELCRKSADREDVVARECGIGEIEREV